MNASSFLLFLSCPCRLDTGVVPADGESPTRSLNRAYEYQDRLEASAINSGHTREIESDPNFVD